MKYLGLALLLSLVVVGCDKPVENGSPVPQGTLGATVDPKKVPATPPVTAGDVTTTDPTVTTGPGCSDECNANVDCTVPDAICLSPKCTNPGSICSVCGWTVNSGYTWCTDTCCGNFNGTCSATTCAIACNANFGDCNGDLHDGCELGLTNNATNCGSCGNNCTTKPNVATGGCSGTSCTVSACNTGYADCNTGAGCESSVGAVTSCGSCAGAANCNTAVSNVPTIAVQCVANGGTSTQPVFKCSYTGGCNAGFADCDTDKSNGCEINTNTDKTHCGACGTDCTALANVNGAAVSCVSGSCVVAVGTSACSAGYANCDGTVSNGCEINLTNNTNHCGACATDCTALPNVGTVSCAASACSISTCAADYGNCDGAPGNGCETHFTDAATCGTSCGNKVNCNTNPNVSAGACNGSRQCTVTTCNAGYGDCSQANTNDGCETNLTTNTNCGTTCGNKVNCTALSHVGSTSCNGSRQCVIGSCAAGYADCVGGAADGCETHTDVDASNCGACSKVCSSNNVTASCSGGTCSGACAADFGDCDSNKQTNGCESSLQTDVLHCGGCGMPCSTSHITADCTGASCEGGTCAAGFADCNTNKRSDGCEVTLGTDPDNCSACGTVCSSNNMATRTCATGACNGTCAANFADCDGNKQTNGCEINTKTDAANCGGCTMACSGNHVTPACTNGGCTGACDADFGDCNSDKRTDGCETDLRVTVASCGSCGFDCKSKEVHVADNQKTCEASVCSYTGECDTGWGNCDDDKANGCETSILTSTANCGTCGHACTPPANATAVCTSGECDFTCTGGLLKCTATGTCAACCLDSDCRTPPDPSDKCIVGKCNAGACEYKPKSCVTTDCFSNVSCNSTTGECKGTPLTGNSCGQAGCCQIGGTCSDGVCQCVDGKGKDCSTGLTACEAGLCSSGGQCEKETLPNDTTCTAADKCLLQTACSNGACVGTPKTCTPSGPCKTSTCTPGSGECVEGNADEGLPCSTGDSCVQNEACNASGECKGTVLPDNTPCARTDCGSTDLVICMSGLCSCVVQPDMTVAPDDMAVTGVDLAGSGADMAKGHDKHKGCSAAGGPPPVEILSMLALVAVFVRPRRRR